jgi:hypothetical protein
MIAPADHVARGKYGKASMMTLLVVTVCGVTAPEKGLPTLHYNCTPQPPMA